MNFEDRKKQIIKHSKLASKSQEQINNNPFVIAKRKLIDRHQTAIKELLAGCTHDVVEKKSQYYDGSYYDQAHTEHWVVCTLCGAKSDTTSESHSWYG